MNYKITIMYADEWGTIREFKFDKEFQDSSWFEISSKSFLERFVFEFLIRGFDFGASDGNLIFVPPHQIKRIIVEEIKE